MKSLDERGGKAEDTGSLMPMAKDIRNAFSGTHEYTTMLPASYWYLQNFDLKKHEDSVDWF
jgi:chitinase